MKELHDDILSAKSTAKSKNTKPGKGLFGEKYNRSVRKALRHATALNPDQLQLGTDDLTDLSRLPLAQVLDKLPAAMTLESLHSQASKLHRATWGGLQRQDREAEAIIQRYMDAQTAPTYLSDWLTGSSSAVQQMRSYHSVDVLPA